MAVILKFTVILIKMQNEYLQLSVEQFEVSVDKTGYNKTQVDSNCNHFRFVSFMP